MGIACVRQEVSSAGNAPDHERWGVGSVWRSPLRLLIWLERRIGDSRLDALDRSGTCEQVRAGDGRRP